MNDETGALGIITELDVPAEMRDGTILRANIFRPDGPGRFPAILLRTPYRKKTEGFERYVRCGYVVAIQDTRGRYASDGEYAANTVESDKESEDGYDSVEWAAVQPWCNGKVGVLGGSYGAWMAWMLAKLRPPHLAALCAFTIPVEAREVDWVGGAFRPGRRVNWWMTSIAPK